MPRAGEAKRAALVINIVFVGHGKLSYRLKCFKNNEVQDSSWIRYWQCNWSREIKLSYRITTGRRWMTLQYLNRPPVIRDQLILNFENWKQIHEKCSGIVMLSDYSTDVYALRFVNAPLGISMCSATITFYRLNYFYTAFGCQ